MYLLRLREGVQLRGTDSPCKPPNWEEGGMYSVGGWYMWYEKCNGEGSMVGVEDECVVWCSSIINVLWIYGILIIASSRGPFRTHSKT